MRKRFSGWRMPWVFAPPSNRPAGNSRIRVGSSCSHRRARLALPVRHRISAERSARRVARGLAAAHRFARRPPAPAVLSLRSAHGPLWPGHHPRDAGRGHRHRAGCCRDDRPPAPPGATRHVMIASFSFQLLPERASDVAVSVDAIFYALLAVCGLIAIGIFVAVAVFSMRYRRGSPAVHAAPRIRSVWLEATWTAATCTAHLPGHLRLGGRGLFSHVPAAGQCHGDPRRRQAMDVENATPRRAR